MDWKRVGMPLGAAALIVVGVLVLDWANVATPMGASVRLSPLGEEVCLGDVSAQATRGFGTWKACARPLVLLGGVTALAMIGVVIVRLLGIGLGPLERAVTWLAVTLIASAGAAMVASGASLGELGGGGFVTVTGGVLALVSKVSLGASFGTGRSARPIRSTAKVVSTAADPYREPAVPTPASTSPRRGAPSVADLEPERRVGPPAPLSKGAVRLNPVGPVAADATRSALRFVVMEGPAIVIEADSADFFAGGRDPLMFPALKKFVEWDRRYG